MGHHEGAEQRGQTTSPSCLNRAAQLDNGPSCLLKLRTHLTSLYSTMVDINRAVYNSCIHIQWSRVCH